MNRQPEHLCDFFLTELGATGSVTEKSLTLKGYFYLKSFESIISKYYNEYVKCPSCLSGNTDLEKDQYTRSHKLTYIIYILDAKIAYPVDMLKI